ncbi:putative acyl-CoA dehydrogenase [Actinoplanes missouriensis 431]|uniref:Putative acyl-CoA dehydrogenase n=1 Tax=Actinoplanes missouriensis (strain ATCC 14538 / DSM 43046 / CBS 188.64 / JCM 3121 / NBRC 102363 / NCIMB 12654 / NRRL B-3342 / UNCC 431) TaxID=512565 RepID=I0H2Z8_ACTM4|nr:acyl-CoA dehydrogenase family protein [Actinoplanes missouriensis]BAL87385.1 putative acyl-CoA dehydrogenase [Actinoplanes missouriensis 431]
MHVGYTPEQEKLRLSLRSYFAELMTPSLRQSLDDPEGEYGDGAAYREVVRQLGRDGWLSLDRLSRMEQLIFTDEAALAGVPVPFLTLYTVAPTIARHGTAVQKEDLLPRIAAGEAHFSIGYSEPEAGTDLASLRTRAVRNGDSYVINGQKMWTSLIRYADYVWLACRTDPDAPRHRGLSILIVPTDAPGFSWTPVRTVAGPTTSATYYSDVRVPASALVGEENQGWRLITDQLNHERVALTSAAPLQRSLAEVLAWAKANGVTEREWVRLHLARVHAKVEVLKLFNWRVASGTLSPVDASAGKVYGTELAIEAYRLLREVVSAAGTVPDEAVTGRIERMCRSSLILTFGGGANEVQRDIIAAAALGLPVRR